MVLLLIAACAPETSIPTPGPPAPVNNIAGEGIWNGVGWRVEITVRGDEVCFETTYEGEPDGGSSCSQLVDEPGLINVGPSTSGTHIPTIYTGTVDPRVSWIRVETVTDGVQLTQPRPIKDLGEAARAFAVAFPPISRLQAIVALDAFGNVMEVHQAP